MASQWCPTCTAEPGMPADMVGRWVQVEGHEHELSRPRPEVYLYESAHDGQPPKWAAFVAIWLDELSPGAESYWLGWREFPTLPEAMEYARTLAVKP